MVAATCSSSWVYQGNMHTISSGTGLQVGLHQLLQVGTLPGSCADHCKMPLPYRGCRKLTAAPGGACGTVAWYSVG